MKTNKQQQQQGFTVSPEMMDVFQQLLFSKEGGVNLDTIANDIFFGEPTDYDKCRLACAFKGVQIKAPEPIYEADYKGYKVYTPVAFSFIKESYLCEVTVYKCNDGEWTETRGEDTTMHSITFHQAGSNYYYSDFDECKKHIKGLDK